MRGEEKGGGTRGRGKRRIKRYAQPQDVSMTTRVQHLCARLHARTRCCRCLPVTNRCREKRLAKVSSSCAAYRQSHCDGRESKRDGAHTLATDY